MTRSWLKCQSDSRRGRIFKAVSSGAATKLLTGAVSLLTLPLAVRYLGAERYGVWATITTTAVWINLLDLGIANTLTNEISRAYALGDKEAARRYFTNALALTLAVACAVGLLFTCFAGQVRWAGIFNVGTSVSATEVEQTVVAAVGLMLLPYRAIWLASCSPDTRSWSTGPLPQQSALQPVWRDLPWALRCTWECRCFTSCRSVA